MKTEPNFNEFWNIGRRTNKKRAQREYFADDGLYATWTRKCASIDELVENGMARTGAIVAWGTLSDGKHSGTRQLRHLIQKKRVGTIELRVALSMLRHQIEAQDRFFARTFC